MARSPSRSVVQAMCDVISHRGPDDEGFYTDDNAAIGMRRLSIIDLETGHQPVSNEDGTVWVVFNGEIYNFKELRRDLESRGHRFSTTTDTETIVHLYEEHGADVVNHLRGMFAFAVWDAPRRRLLLARDRLGIKPLFYAELDGGLAFASELKSLLTVPEIERAPELAGARSPARDADHAERRQHHRGRAQAAAGASRHPHRHRPVSMGPLLGAALRARLPQQ